jgi:hypothetical protein
MTQSPIDRSTLAWQRLAPTLERLGAASSPAQLATDWRSCVECIRGLFASYYGNEAVDSRLAIPADYGRFMTEFGDGWHQPAGLGRDIFAAATVGTDTAYYFNAYVIDRDEESEPLADNGLWLSIGWFADKHEIVLCCDRSHSYYGKVIDFHDSHPWLNGIYCGSLVLADSFGEWLEILGKVG